MSLRIGSAVIQLFGAFARGRVACRAMTISRRSSSTRAAGTSFLGFEVVRLWEGRDLGVRSVVVMVDLLFFWGIPFDEISTKQPPFQSIDLISDMQVPYPAFQKCQFVSDVPPEW